MESEKKKICPKCKHEDGSGQNNIHSMNPEHFCKCSIRSIMERDGVCYHCAFWIRLYEENKNNPNWLIIDGESWIVHPFVPNTDNKTRRFMGMGETNYKCHVYKEYKPTEKLFVLKGV